MGRSLGQILYRKLVDCNFVCTQSHFGKCCFGAGEQKLVYSEAAGTDAFDLHVHRPSWHVWNEIYVADGCFEKKGKRSIRESGKKGAAVPTRT